MCWPPHGMPWRRAEFASEAKAELVAAAEWYEVRAPGVGSAFLDHVEKTLAVIVEHPGAGRPHAKHSEVRLCPLRRFPFVLVYAEGAPIVVIAVAHTRREPDYWR